MTPAGLSFLLLAAIFLCAIAALFRSNGRDFAGWGLLAVAGYLWLVR